MAGALRRKWDGERLSTVPASREFARIVTTAQVQKLADHEVLLSIRQGCMPGSRHDVGGSRNDGISRVTSSAWVLAIAWALMLIFGIPRFRELWRGHVRLQPGLSRLESVSAGRAGWGRGYVLRRCSDAGGWYRHDTRSA